MLRAGADNRDRRLARARLPNAPRTGWVLDPSRRLPATLQSQPKVSKRYYTSTDTKHSTDSDVRFACPACAQELRRAHDLITHIARSCSGQEHRWKCTTCDAVSHSKEYGPQPRMPHKHTWRDEYTYLPRFFGCPCCGMFLQHFRAFQEHVRLSGHDENEAYRPHGIGHVHRLQGLLQQPRVLPEMQKYCPFDAVFTQWMQSLRWDHELARQAADKLQHRFVDPSEGLEEQGVPLGELVQVVHDLMARCQGVAQHEANEVSTESVEEVCTYQQPTKVRRQPVTKPVEHCTADHSTNGNHKHGVSVGSTLSPQAWAGPGHSSGMPGSSYPPVLTVDTTNLDACQWDMPPTMTPASLSEDTLHSALTPCDLPGAQSLWPLIQGNSHDNPFDGFRWQDKY